MQSSESFAKLKNCFSLFSVLHPITKRKGYSQNESPNVKTKALAIVLLCTHEESGCIFFMWFSENFYPDDAGEWKKREICIFRGCICRFALGFCKNIKKRTETLYQSFSPFMVEYRGVEPLASTMRMSRATNCANTPCKFCLNSIARRAKKSKRELKKECSEEKDL